ncbi:MAG TPA: zinc ribbon domain-containing protein [Candidatus Gemmiger faecigallinarum]|nr:zinc ribbon domain-containing protein [Candidatus Gemmiger faecigallinarum]
MKHCPHCGNQIKDEAAFCPYCGSRFEQPGSVGDSAQGQPQSGTPGGYPPQPNVVMVAPYDHTREYAAQDVSDNKVFCMVIYLMGVIGVIIGVLASHDSPYVRFHVRQALKCTVLEALLALCLIAAALLCVTVVLLPLGILAALVVAVMYVILLVVRVICFVEICMGKAVEPPIVRSLGFLK